MTQASVNGPVPLFLALFSSFALVSEFAQDVLLDFKLNDARATAISK